MSPPNGTTLNTQHSTLNTQHSTLNTQHSTLNTQHSTLKTQHSTLNTQHSTLNTQHPTLNTQHSKLNTQHLTLNTRHLTLNTQHSTLACSGGVSGRRRGRAVSVWSPRTGCHRAFRRATSLQATPVALRIISAINDSWPWNYSWGAIMVGVLL